MFKRRTETMSYKTYIVDTYLSDRYEWKHIEKDDMQSYNVDWNKLYEMLETDEERESRKKIEFREERLSKLLDK